MKTLIVTGQLAFETVRKTVLNIEDTDVLVLPVAVASLITPQKLIFGFLSSPLSKNKYDAVLVSGFSKFNFSKAEAEIGCPIYLGPKHAADLKYALEVRNFSKTIPACEFLQTQKKEQALELLETYETEATSSFHIESVSLGGNSRMKVLAEIVSAETLSFSELKSQILYLISEGADIIDLGFSPDACEKTVSDITAYAKSICPIPISIDSSEFHQILAGIASGTDLVLSVDSRILNAYSELFSCKDFSSYPFFEKVAFVVIPDLFSSGSRLESLEKNIAGALNLGIKKIIADPILSPSGNLTSSLNDYFVFRQRNPDIPVLFGAGNVTELIDADSVGANAILAALAAECGASLLFTPNAGDKGKGSVRELKTASEMMLLSKIRESSPKDLGIDLLILKEKRRRPDFNFDLISKKGAFDSLHLRDDAVAADSILSDSEGNSNFSREFIFTGSLKPNFEPNMKWGWKPDKAGNFIIGVLPVFELIRFLSFDLSTLEIEKLKTVSTPGQRVIAAIHPSKIIIGTDSAFMLEMILNENLISELSHAGYLGRELQKAELAILLGRSYSQDDIF
jgi:Dihydropteroate synthase and related enzymes